MFNMKRNPVRKEQVTAVLAVALFYGALQLAGITCPIKYITGISCPGCGMTRAWLSLILRGDIKCLCSCTGTDFPKGPGKRCLIC